MAKNNLPHIPLYIGDWEKDCNVLSLESEAAWLRIIFKMFSKGKQSTIKIPTKSLQNLWRCSAEKVQEIIDDFIYNEICDIDIEGGFVSFTCRRFVKENKLSKTRSEARKKGYEKNKTTTKPNQNKNKKLQNADNDNDNDIDNNNDNDNEDKTELYPTFEDFWNCYDKKTGLIKKIKPKWDRLHYETKCEIMEYIPYYIASQPEKKYRKNPETFLNNEGWKDEIIKSNNNDKSISNSGGYSEEFKQRIARGLVS